MKDDPRNAKSYICLERHGTKSYDETDKEKILFRYMRVEDKTSALWWRRRVSPQQDCLETSRDWAFPFGDVTLTFESLFVSFIYNVENKSNSYESPSQRRKKKQTKNKRKRKKWLSCLLQKLIHADGRWLSTDQFMPCRTHTNPWRHGSAATALSDKSVSSHVRKWFSSHGNQPKPFKVLGRITSYLWLDIDSVCSVAWVTAKRDCYSMYRKMWDILGKE